MANFALTGVAGYIAPRHLKAIKETGCTLVAATDPHDSVGILDSFFPNTAFFTEYERFDRHLEKMRRTSEEDRVHYVSICSPNYLHDAHIRTALRVGAHALCEKPLVLNPWNLDVLEQLEQEYDQHIFTVLQLRVHPQLVALRERLLQQDIRHQVKLTYITSRGRWYLYSWKGDASKSGGVLTNIGIHFFDMLIWLFGDVHNWQVDIQEPMRAGGTLTLEQADVSWFLSIDGNDLPAQVQGKQPTFRFISVDDNEIEFSTGFRDLHTEVYRDMLEGNGFRIADARPSIELVYHLRQARTGTSQ